MKDILTETLFFKKEDKKALEKKLNASNAKNGCDLDYEVGNVQAFIDEFKIQKIKKTRKTINKRKEMRRKVEKEVRKKVEKEMREKVEKEMRQSRKRIKRQNKKLKNLTTNQITNNFKKIIKN